jgi:hypothetical protein
MHETAVKVNIKHRFPVVSLRNWIRSMAMYFHAILIAKFSPGVIKE